MLERAVRDAGSAAGRAMIRVTPVDTGRARGNWEAFNGPDREVSSKPSKFDQQGAATEAEVSAVVSKWRLKDGQLSIVNATEDPVTGFKYILSLEQGSSLQNPSGMLPFGVQAGLRELRKLGTVFKL
ncbi:MAG: hypothetical protein L0312_05365 [Acidobacteria bacterium]|nr:hypothetical protein [Acidobacteriota bacterium]